MARKKAPAEIQRQVFARVAALEGVDKPVLAMNRTPFRLADGTIVHAYLSTDRDGRFALYVEHPDRPLRCTDVGQLVLSILQAE
jgi:hypothetical protein